MNIYTRTGDNGETDLLSGSRVRKDTARLEACGELDELDALLGAVRCEQLPEGVAVLLEEIQQRMVPLRAELISLPSAKRGEAVDPAEIERLEREIDCLNGSLEPLTTFIVPGGSRAAAALHVARAVCRRAERRLVTLDRAEPSCVSSSLLAYINRLSDLLFVLARYTNAKADVKETPC